MIWAGIYWIKFKAFPSPLRSRHWKRSLRSTKKSWSSQRTNSSQIAAKAIMDRAMVKQIYDCVELHVLTHSFSDDHIGKHTERIEYGQDIYIYIINGWHCTQIRLNLIQQKYVPTLCVQWNGHRPWYELQNTDIIHGF